jgi:PAS domain-containing protein
MKQNKSANGEIQIGNITIPSLIAHAPIGLAFFDHEHRFVYVNDFLANINGIPEKDHINNTIK